MYIHHPQQAPQCSQCGSQSSEHFSDATHSGTRCKSCGHESKKLHPWLEPQTSGAITSPLRADRPPTF